MNTELLLGYLEDLHQEFMPLTDGAVASYIPELLKADPQWFGIALVTVDGHIYQVGTTRQEFTIQSISKAITYGIGLEDSGVDTVLRKIDVEPSGEAFNSISLEPGTGRPRNPMINAGAIAAMAFVRGETADDKLKRILDTYSRYLGHPVRVDDEVYRSEKSTGHRNRAIASMLRNYDILEADEDQLLDLYFKQCSILVNCRDLALIAATLANDGINPVTGVRAIRSEFVPKLLSVMTSCGMYDFSGAWVYEVGMPAKSGVGGGIMAVLPGQLGLAVFSPRLDERGNSARGIAVCKRISRDFGLHVFHAGRTTATSVVHATYDASRVTSKRVRNSEQTRLLQERGKAIVVFELQGDLMFASAEIVVTEAQHAAEEADYIILDLRRIAALHEGAANLLAHLIENMVKEGKHLFLTNVRDQHSLTKVVKRRIPNLRELPLLRFEDLDDALEWCEDQLLADLAGGVEEEVPLSEQAFCRGFSDEERNALEALLEPRTFEKGAIICRAGDPANEVFFIVSGQVSVMVHVDPRRDGRVTSLSAGTAFGEMAVLDQGPRSADIVADTAVSCLVLRYDRLEQDNTDLGQRIRIKLVTNIARDLTQKLRRSTLEIKSLKA
jgi:glutaminase